MSNVIEAQEAVLWRNLTWAAT